MMPPSSSFFTRSITEGAERPTCSASLVCGMRPLVCSRLIICRSIASSSGESPPNFIRQTSIRLNEDKEIANFCQGKSWEILDSDDILLGQDGRIGQNRREGSAWTSN